MCAKNYDHMMYDSWDKEHNRLNVLSFWAIFSPFTALTMQTITCWKNGKMPGDIITLHKCTKNHDHMLYCAWDMARDKSNCYFSFWSIFAPFYPPNSPKIKILKNEKKTSRYHHFPHVYQKLWSDDVGFLRYGAQQMDGQTGGGCPT